MAYARGCQAPLRLSGPRIGRRPLRFAHDMFEPARETVRQAVRRPDLKVSIK